MRANFHPYFLLFMILCAAACFLTAVPVGGLDDPRFQVQVTITGQGSFVIDPNQEDFAYGERVRVLAIPDAGHDFAGWSGDINGPQNPADFAITSDMALTATFVPKPPATLTLHLDGDGAVTVEPLQELYDWGETVTLTAVPGTGSIFLQWQGDLSGSTNPVTITMDEDKAITAVFVLASLATPVSDDFHSCLLDAGLWSLLNPAGDGQTAMTGTAVALQVPAAVEHNLWMPNSDALRIMQPTGDHSFAIEVKFDSLPAADGQLAGVIIQQDAANWLRFGLTHDGTSLVIDTVRTLAGASSMIHAAAVDPGGSQAITLRVSRNGDAWTYSYSFNGSGWATHVAFNQGLSVSQAGLFAGNYAATPGSEPAFTALVDYFMNTAVPTANAGPSAVTISKITEPAATTPFDFSGDLGEFSLQHGQSKTGESLCAADYQIREANENGWVLAAITCDSTHVSSTADGVTIHLPAGEHISCSFKNRRLEAVPNAGGPYTGTEGTAVPLDASGSSGRDLIKTYNWDCTDDGIIDQSAAVPTGSTCTYRDNGVYTVRLTIVDILNRSASAAAQVSISNMAPTVDAGPDQAVTAGMEVYFGGSFADPGSLDTHTIGWNFGDGSVKSGTLFPRHTFAYSGTYSVTLTVTDDDGGVGTDSLVVSVANRPPTLSSVSVYPGTINEGESFFLSGNMADTAPGTGLTLIVNWGDGQVTNHAFMPGCTAFSLVHHCLDDAPGDMDGGSLVIRLKLLDEEGAFSTATAVIQVNNVAPQVDAGADRIVTTAVAVPFTAAVSDPGVNDTHTITWDFGDGTPAQTGDSVSHPFTRTGTYIVSVTAEDDDGGIGVDEVAVTVRAAVYLPVIMKP